jgi:hypothetical protein
MQRLDSVAAPQPHWHIAVDLGYGDIEIHLDPVYWVMNDAWEVMNTLSRNGTWVWTMVECKDLECVLREMST